MTAVAFETAPTLLAGLAIATVVVASRTLARRSGVPYPVFLVVAGSGASFVPQFREITLDPRFVFLVILPPLIYHAGVIASPWELRAHARSIGLGSLGLVVATAFAVAGVAVAVVPELGWAGALVLGSVVAPTDPVAATSILARLGVRAGISTVLEGESLVNDGTALALFTVAVAAIGTPTTMGGAVLTFLKVAAGGVAFGLVVGWVVARVPRPAADTPSEIVISLLVPFVAYLPADAMGVSGVLATLTAALVVGERSASGLGPSGRIRMAEFWDVLSFLLESVLFVLVGLQLRTLLAAEGAYPAAEVAALAGLSVAVVVGLRLLWWLALPTLRWRPEGRLIDTGTMPVRERIALGWSGPRGAISLAAALSIPTAVAGHVVPDRDPVIFTTFCVIAATLVGQGTSLPALLRRLGVTGSAQHRREWALAERRCAERALRMLDEMVAGDEVSERSAELMRGRLERRLERAQVVAEAGGDTGPAAREVRRAAEQRLLTAQHEVLRELHRAGLITAAVMRQVRRELDLEQARFDQG